MGLSAILKAVGGAASSGAKSVASAAGRGSISLLKKTPGVLMRASGADRVPILNAAYKHADEGVKKLGQKLFDRHKEDKKERDTDRKTKSSQDKNEKQEDENKKAHDEAQAEGNQQNANKQLSTLEAMGRDIAVIKENTSGGIGGKPEKEQEGLLSKLGGMITGLIGTGLTLFTTGFGKMFTGVFSGIVTRFNAVVGALRSVFTAGATMLANAGKSLLGVLGGLKDKAKVMVDMGKNLVSRGVAGAKALGTKAAQAASGLMTRGKAAAVATARKLAPMVKTGGELLARQGGKGIAKTVLKKIPLVGAAVGLGLAGHRAWGGDWAGAGLEAASGLVGTVPLVGTAASLALDGYGAKRDMDREDAAAAALSPSASGDSTLAPMAVNGPEKQKFGVDPPALPPTSDVAPTKMPKISPVAPERSVVAPNSSRNDLFGFVRSMSNNLGILTEAATTATIGVFSRPVDDALKTPFNPELLKSIPSQGSSAPSAPATSAEASAKKGPTESKERAARRAEIGLPPLDQSDVLSRGSEEPRAPKIEPILPPAETPGVWKAEGSESTISGDGGLISSASEAGPILDLIAKGESGAAGYDAAWGGSKVKPTKPLSEMTIGEVKAWQKETLNEQISRGVPQEKRSSAAGRYQFISGTLKATQAKAGLDDDAMFNQENQDLLATTLLDQDKKRGLGALKSGKTTPEQFQDYVASQWASIKNSKGKGVYDDAGFNHAGIGKSEFSKALSETNLVAAPANQSQPLREVAKAESAKAPIIIQAPAAPQQQITKASGPSSGSPSTPNVAMYSRNPDKTIRSYSEGMMRGAV